MNCTTILKEAHIANDINVRLAKSGDKGAFAALINCHRQDLYKVAKGILGSDFDAADAIQEAIISAYNNIGALKNDAFFKTWIIRILINECKKILRNSRKTIPIQEVSERAVSDIYPSDSDVPNYINMLETDLKYVIVLYYYEDLSIKEIAEILKIPAGTVKTRLLRARHELSKMISGRGDYENEK